MRLFNARTALQGGGGGRGESLQMGTGTARKKCLGLIYCQCELCSWDIKDKNAF
jgi:hypothetical protein